MFATNVVTELPVGPDVQDNDDIVNGFAKTDKIVNSVYVELYNFLKLSIANGLILNLVHETPSVPLDQVFKNEENFFSTTLEKAQQFQQSQEFQQYVVQPYQDAGATVTVITNKNVDFDNLLLNDTLSFDIDLIDVETPYFMRGTQHPLVD